MSDKSSRTEDATAGKMTKSRKKGQLPRSKELSGTLTFFALVLGLVSLGPNIVRELEKIFRALFVAAFEVGGGSLPTAAIRESFYTSFVDILLPLLGLLTVVEFLSSNIIGGFNFSTEAFNVSLGKLNPLPGFKRLFSVQSIYMLVKSVVIVSVLLWISWGTFKGEIHNMPSMVTLGVPEIAAKLAGFIVTISFRFALFMLAVAVFDVLYQKYRFGTDMKMTKEEVKDENKESEGNPEIKGKIRQKQFQAAYRRMLRSVPQATAVVTNPTHFAVAIRYVPKEMDAPEVVAKGKDHLALKIRRIAEEHGVPIVENKPLAQTLYHSADVGERIPPMLYKAVAELLAYLHKQGKWKQKITA